MTMNFDKTFIIAEIGTSHQGDLKKAYELVDAAREAGADCVKFQLVFADEIIHPGTGLVDLPTGKIDLYAEFRKLEASPDFFGRLKERVEQAGLFFLCTPFGARSARILRNLDVRP
jgi:sialic acid synthase SpsE